MTKTVIADGQEVSTSDAEITEDEQDGRLVKEYARTVGHNRVWKAGDMMEVRLGCILRFVDRKSQVFAANQLPAETPVEMAIFYGPWLLGVNAVTNPMFHGEPYAENVLLVPDDETALNAVTCDANADPLLNGPRLMLNYRHGGFPDPATVILQPVGEQTNHLQTTVSFRHLVQRVP